MILYFTLYSLLVFVGGVIVGWALTLVCLWHGIGGKRL